MRIIALLLLAFAAASAQEVKSFDIVAASKWIDTGLKLEKGDRYSIEATGEMSFPGPKETVQSTGPEGIPRGFRDLLRMLPVNDSGRGALIARIGDRETSMPFFAGPSKQSVVSLGGNLFLGVNVGGNDRGTGKYVVKVSITKADPAAVPTKSVATSVQELTQQQLETLPRRVVDAEGNEGDRVNFVVVGAEAAVVNALKSAGWVQVDRDAKASILSAILSSMSKQAYLTIPMSELMMFDRVQDYGFAHAVPFVVVAQRHHFRIWKAPFTVGGVDVWVGAGTHDIGFEKDQRNNGITHKIDPETDKERDFIGQTLVESGSVVKQTYMTVANPIKEAKTATGGSFRSDGRTQITYMEQLLNEQGQRFANLFCSVLKTNPDGGKWGECTDYIETKPKEAVELLPMSRDYRVLVVPGIFSSCASEAPAFDLGRAYLKEKQGIDAELFAVSNNSSEDNAKALGKFLREQWTKDSTRKYILVGYSKGTPDIQTALATDPEIRPMIAAFISIAGASGGSSVADALPAKLDATLAKLTGKGGCKGDLGDGLKSLAVGVRRQFLARYPNPFVPTFSIPAVADKDRVSKVMLQSWHALSGSSPRNDAQLAEIDAIIPGSTYLGAARSDHFALALPLENMQGGALKSLLDKNTYPRAALLVSAVRYALLEMEAPAGKPIVADEKKTSIFHD